MKLEDIVFWFIIAALIGLAFWLFRGSPTTESAIISVAVFVATSEMLLWRKMFEVEKKTAVSFAWLKSDVTHIKSEVGAIKNDMGDITKTRPV